LTNNEDEALELAIKGCKILSHELPFDTMDDVLINDNKHMYLLFLIHPIIETTAIMIIETLYEKFGNDTQWLKNLWT